MSQQVLSAIAKLHQDVLSMRAELASLQSILSSQSTAGTKDNVEASSSSTKGKKDKKKRVMPVGEDGKPILNKWVIFTNRVRALCKDNGVDNLKFCSSLKDAHPDNYETLTDEDIQTARSSWIAPAKEVKASSGSDTETSSKPKKQRKSKKQAVEDVPSSSETVATNVTSSTTTTTTAATSTTEKKKRGPKAGSKKAKEAAKVELPPTTEDDGATDGEAEEPAESPIVFKGKKYWYNANTGAAYERGDNDARGAYKGIFNPKDPKTGKPSLDTAAPEPTA